MEFKHFNRDCPINLKHMFILPMKPSLRGDMWLLHTSLWLSVKLHSLTIMESYILAKNILNTVQFMSHAAAKPLQSCPTLCNPIDGSHQAPQSLGFSRQEHWTGLPFTSPVHESEKSKWSCSVMSYSSRPRSIMSYSSRPHGLQPTRLLPPMGFSKEEYWRGLSCHILTAEWSFTSSWSSH